VRPAFKNRFSVLEARCRLIETPCRRAKDDAMKSTKKKTLVRAKHAGSSDSAVDAVFAAYPKPLKARQLALRRLILDTAKKTEGVGALQES
jgi:hypothetical protein